MPRLTQLRTMLAANDLRETIAFYERLGFECVGRYPEDTEQFFWCQVARDNVRLMFNWIDPTPHAHEDGEVHAHDPVDPALAGSIYLDVDDIDALFEEFKGVVDEFHFEIDDQPHGMREFAVEDPNGYVLLFGSPTPS